MPMSDALDTALASPAFRGEPGETSPDAVGGWDANDAREYREYVVQKEMREFAEIYGWRALQALFDETLTEVRSS